MRAAIFVSLLSIAMTSCNCDSGKNSTSRNPQKSQPARLYYQMSDEDRTKLFNNLKLLQVGDNYQRVIDVLGKPSHDNILMTKGPSQEFIARDLIYYIVRCDKDMMNDKYDQKVDVLLDSQDRLTKIVLTTEQPKP